MQQLTLVGYDFCPFLQPLIIAFEEKGAGYEVRYLKYQEEPEWLLQLSPQGRTPLLKVGEEVLFDSAAIFEFIDEAFPGTLYSSDPLQKAVQRRWVSTSDRMLSLIYQIKVADNMEAFIAAEQQLLNQLAKLSDELSAANCFQSDVFGAVEAAFAPVVRTLSLLDSHFGTGILKCTPLLQGWADRVLARASVKASICKDYEDIVLAQIAQSTSVLPSLKEL